MFYLLPFLQKKIINLNKNHAQKHNLKYSFTILELSIVIVIITVMLSVVLISKSLITTAKINKVQKDYRDINTLMSIFQNTYDCLPGDCSISILPQNIVDKTPSGCFNLSTTTGLGNSLSSGNSGSNTVLTGSNIIISSFNTGQIESSAKRTCSFYEMQAFEPQAFISHNTKKRNSLKRNSAVASKKVLTNRHNNNKNNISNKDNIGNYRVDSGGSNYNNNYFKIGFNNKNNIGLSSKDSNNSFKLASNSNTYYNDKYNNTSQYNKYQNNVDITNVISALVGVNSAWAIGGGGSFTLTNAASYIANSSAQAITSNQNNLNTAVTAVNTAQTNFNAQIVNINSAWGGALVGSQSGGLTYMAAFLACYPAPTYQALPQSSSGYGLWCYNTSYLVINGYTMNQLFLGISNQMVSATVTINNYTSGSNPGLAGCTYSGTQITTCNSGVLGNTLTHLQALGSQPGYIIEASIGGTLQPSMPSFQKQAMWDFRSVGSMSSSGGFYPYELNDTTNMATYIGKNLLIARSNSVNSLNDTTNDMSAFSANIAQKINAKYDDGMPYTGNIIAGQNISQMGTGKGCTTLTTISSTSLANPIISVAANFINSNNNALNTGCVLGWVMG